MIDGVVNLRQVIFHPVVVIGSYGLLKFYEILMKGLSRRHYQFVQIVFSRPCDRSSHPAGRRMRRSKKGRLTLHGMAILGMFLASIALDAGRTGIPAVPTGPDPAIRISDNREAGVQQARWYSHGWVASGEGIR